jgi:DNA-binding Lrp family transcriptional regulator
MILKPQDILFLLKLVALGRAPWTYNELAIELGMSPSEVHAAAKRAVAAGLAVLGDNEIRPNIRNFEEFLLHGLRYYSVPERGAKTRGIPTLTSAPPLDELFVSSDEVSVWPDADGHIRGEAFTPLYRSAPEAARRDPELYELLVITDALRGGRARERQIAARKIKERLKAYG